ncbi:MAG TPA: SAM-dependent methyltransferase [Opitutaceae bacterium]|nr:SAM-dependent methyltransferase [Opitutaceae bacterium]
MALALYDPAAGYYRSERTRIGYGEGTDFFTATTSGPLFGELVAAACVKLLGPRDPRTFTFVELGVDSGEGIMAGVSHPFGSTRAIRLGEPIALAGACVVFSNELFDAQPFQRFVFRDGAWRELGVRLRGDALLETELPAAADDIARLPRAAAAGYVIDAPFAAAALAVEITRQPWSGLFVACDYGKSWRELTEATPAGTARAYFRHAQSNQLLAQPGAQDLTCHVCWDWLANALADGGFAPPTLESQEAFLVHHAAELIARISADEAVHLSRRKLALMQLLHPAHLGQKFQVLHASRV